MAPWVIPDITWPRGSFLTHHGPVGYARHIMAPWAIPDTPWPRGSSACFSCFYLVCCACGVPPSTATSRPRTTNDAMIVKVIQGHRLTPKVVVRTCNGVELRDLGHRRMTEVDTSRSGRDRIGNRLASSSTSSNMFATLQTAGAGVGGTAASRSNDDDADQDASTSNFSPEVVRAIEGVKFIAEHLKQEDEARYVSSTHMLPIFFTQFVKLCSVCLDCVVVHGSQRNSGVDP